jgi:GTP-binding protein EngB required for normal cell division
MFGIGTRNPLPERLAALKDAVEASQGRLEPAALEPAESVVKRVGARLAFSGDVTVVALAGATGSGKSSLFNAISGTTLAEPGVRRPTTSKAMAASFGDANDAILDWLDVPRRHLVTGHDRFSGLILLDLPDHDSTETSHRLEVDRLVQLADQFIWVVDPQKYADAALHDRYLKPLAAHADVMLVVLNQADRLGDGERQRMVADLRRLLADDGLKGTRVIATSAVSGAGVKELQDELAELIKGKRAAALRLAADVEVAAASLRPHIGDAEVDGVPKKRIAHLDETLLVAAGVPVVVDAVAKAWRHRGAYATGWPVLSWLEKFRPDPLRALHLDVLSSKKQPAIEPGRVNRTSLPTAQGVAKARVDSAVRALADETSAGLPRPWQDSIRRAARTDETLLPDHLDRAIATTDLELDRGTGWWAVVRGLQWLVLLTMLVGLGWLGVNFVLTAYLALPALPVPMVGNVGLPTVLALGGLAAGILLAMVSRIGVEIGARSKARAAQAALRRAIGQVTATYVVAPINEELARREKAREALARIR